MLSSQKTQAIAAKLSPFVLNVLLKGGRIMAELRQNANWNEADHPRDNDGKFAKSDSVINNDTTVGTAKLTEHIVPKANGFNRPATHSHLMHAKEMGLNEKQYIKAAEDFFNSNTGKMYRSANGKYFKYDEGQNLVCICNQDGTIYSFYMYKSKNAFRRTMQQEKLEELK